MTVKRLWAIRYDNSGSSVNGKSVGWVFALHCPNLGPGVWSYTKDAAKATTFDSEREAKALREHKWPRAFAVEVTQ